MTHSIFTYVNTIIFFLHCFLSIARSNRFFCNIFKVCTQKPLINVLHSRILYKHLILAHSKLFMFYSKINACYKKSNYNIIIERVNFIFTLKS